MTNFVKRNPHERRWCVQEVRQVTAPHCGLLAHLLMSASSSRDTLEVLGDFGGVARMLVAWESACDCALVSTRSLVCDESFWSPFEDTTLGCVPSARLAAPSECVTIGSPRVPENDHAPGAAGDVRGCAGGATWAGRRQALSQLANAMSFGEPAQLQREVLRLAKVSQRQSPGQRGEGYAAAHHNGGDNAARSVHMLFRVLMLQIAQCPTARCSKCSERCCAY